MIDVPALIAPKKDITLRPVAEREGAITSYRVILVGILREIQRETERSVLPAYRDAQPITDALVTDEAEWFEALRTVVAFATAAAIDAVTTLLGRESVSHARRYATSIRRRVQIDGLERLLLAPTEQHTALMRIYVERNASLITSLGDEAVERVEQMVYEARLSPRAARPTARALRRQIREGLGVSQRRAELIAYDQLASLNSDLTRERHAATGFEFYQWNARGNGRDPRVRPLHRRNHGMVVRWSEAGPGEGGQHAGRPIRCRCVPVAHIPGQGGAIKPVT